MKTPRPARISSLSLAVFTASVIFRLTSLSAAEVIGSGHVVSETRNVSGFHGVELSSSGDVIVTQGDTEGLVIEAEDNILPLLETTVDAKGVLRLGFKEHSGSVSFKKPLIFKLSVKTLDKVVLAGSGDLRAASLTTDKLSIELPGSGDVTIGHLKTDTLKADVTGSGDLTLAGEARAQKIVFAGSGDYEATDLQTDDTTLEINGSAESKVWTNKSLVVEINGSGEVAYRGTPKLKKSINGSGEVHPLAEKKE